MDLNWWLVNAGYLLVALSFLVRDILYLRTLAILAGALLGAVALATQDWPVLFWNVLFTGINLVWLAHLTLRERAVRLHGEAQRLHGALFADLTRLEFQTFLRAGQWCDGAPGTVLAREAQPMTQLLLISEGAAQVTVAGRPVASLGPLHWIGEMSLASGQRASATVTLMEASRYLAWDKAALARLFRRHPSLELVVTQVVNGELCRKLRQSPGAALSPDTGRP